ncbi:MAG: carboxymuconolactone decarboxylase [Desulfuromonas sp.]|nr:MAG: carboxymuconolactone decarboxylase [Desulfuromonas sp.]
MGRLGKLVLTLTALLTMGGGTVIAAESPEETGAALSKRQKSLISIAVLTAAGRGERLTLALHNALDAGLTVNEVNETIVHVYAYAGFPRSFNGMMAFMAVMDERKSKGIEDEQGRDATPVPANLDRDTYGAKVRAQLSGLEEIPPPARWQEFSPVIDTFLKEHLFADLFARDLLSFQERELATIAVLATLRGVEGPLRYHLGAALNTGATTQQLQEFVTVIKKEIGEQEAETAQTLLADVLAARTPK